MNKHKDIKDIIENPSVEREMKRVWDDLPLESVNDQQMKRESWSVISRHIYSMDREESPRLVSFFMRAAAIFMVGLFCGGVGMRIFTQSSSDRVSIHRVVSNSRNSIEEVALSDGTIVTIGPGSTLTYPNAFDGNERRVEIKGQAFFDVAPNKKKPFVVEGEDISVTAVGTSFEVYSLNGVEQTILLTGEVEVAIDGKDDKIRMLPNDKLDYNSLSNSVEVQQVDADRHISWRNGRGMDFVNESLLEIVPLLEKWYDVKIMCSHDLDMTQRYTFETLDKPLQSILDIISESSELKYQLIDGVYELYQ